MSNPLDSEDYVAGALAALGSDQLQKASYTGFVPSGR